MNYGLSVYLNYKDEDIYRVMEKAHKLGFEYIFTSLHIPEESYADYKTRFEKIISYCKENSLNLIADVSPKTLKLLKIDSFDILKDMGFEYLRLDFGFDSEELIELSRDFNLVLNASTFTDELYEELLHKGFDFGKVICCYNYYPKKYTGIARENVMERNDYFHVRNIRTMAFVQGDRHKRGPFFEGLPTCESQRNDDTFYNALYMQRIQGTDILVVGDFDISDKTFNRFENYSKGYIEVECKILNGYEEYLGYVHHDRIDHSKYFIRSYESAYTHKTDKPVNPHKTLERHTGDICVSNRKYMRYNGELEIMLKDLPKDEKVNVIGHTDSNLLRFVDDKIGVLLKKI
ncbi:MAG: MupG family TIM beta-alpha barrel fold protein [Erysipelotrichaceae bacterium]|nr:MupG family TIM beta-alpha barrel fold protein [Erysipelotrichaceae bacterium]